MNDISADLAISVLRFTVGLVMAAHGAQKLFGWSGGPGPDRWAGMVGSMGFAPARPISLMASFAEFFGGLMVAIGLLTPIACGALVVDMAVAIAKVHAPKGFFVTVGGYEYARVLLVAFAVP